MDRLSANLGNWNNCSMDSAVGVMGGMRADLGFVVAAWRRADTFEVSSVAATLRRTGSHAQ
jgi:hypothetical protein